jgi:hypothetical protein
MDDPNPIVETMDGDLILSVCMPPNGPDFFLWIGMQEIKSRPHELNRTAQTRLLHLTQCVAVPPLGTVEIITGIAP